MYPDDFWKRSWATLGLCMIATPVTGWLAGTIGSGEAVLPSSIEDFLGLYVALPFIMIIALPCWLLVNGVLGLFLVGHANVRKRDFVVISTISCSAGIVGVVEFFDDLSASSIGWTDPRQIASVATATMVCSLISFIQVKFIGRSSRKANA